MVLHFRSLSQQPSPPIHIGPSAIWQAPWQQGVPSDQLSLLHRQQPMDHRSLLQLHGNLNRSGEKGQCFYIAQVSSRWQAQDLFLLQASVEQVLQEQELVLVLQQVPALA